MSGDLISSEVQGFFVIAIAHQSDEVCYGVAKRRLGHAGNTRASVMLSLTGGATYNFSVFTVNESGLPYYRSASQAHTVNVTPTSNRQNAIVNQNGKTGLLDNAQHSMMRVNLAGVTYTIISQYNHRIHTIHSKIG